MARRSARPTTSSPPRSPAWPGSTPCRWRATRCVALALANSLFFSIPSGEARGQVALYLVLTMAPFAVISPFIGPAIDRAANGRRLMVILICFSRVLIGLFLIGNLDDLLLFPAALLMLVSGKAYGIAKSAIVPTTVSTDQELIEANSKLSIITGLSGVAAGVPGFILGWIGGPEWIIGFAIVVFAIGTVLAFSLPQAAVAAEPVGEAEEAELRSRGIFLAASSMGLMRAIVGFLVFLLAFALREQPRWHLGLAVGASVFGSFVGSVLAPRVRRTTQEEDILVGSMLLATLAALLAAWSGGLGSAILLAFAVGFGANTAKLAFDSIVQRDAPDANRGRSFAKFETRFQIFWVVGAFLPVILPIPARLGYVTIALAAGFAGVTYWIGRRDAAAGRPPRAGRRSARAPPASRGPGPHEHHPPAGSHRRRRRPDHPQPRRRRRLPPARTRAPSPQPGSSPGHERRHPQAAGSVPPPPPHPAQPPPSPTVTFGCPAVAAARTGA